MSQERMIRTIMDKLREDVLGLVRTSKKEKVSEVKESRSYSVAACVTVKEKDAIDSLCDQYAKEKGWRLSRGALLRLVWLHFLENNKSIDLSRYRS